jgi:hypothetical protein
MITKDTEEKQSDDGGGGGSKAFQPHIIWPGSINSEWHVGILPAYPIARSDDHRVLLLLHNVPNVDRDQCEELSFCGGSGK